MRVVAVAFGEAVFKGNVVPETFGAVGTDKLRLPDCGVILVGGRATEVECD